MNDVTNPPPGDIQGLPRITLRQLEVFRMVCHEKSYSHAALELRSTRANIKRLCDEFEKVMGRRLFEDGNGKLLCPNEFGQGLLTQVGPLSRSLRRLGETVKGLHANGRIVRFGAAAEFFKGGLFTDFLGRLKIAETFRPCFLRIDVRRFRTALLNAECDVYFGAGLAESDRLEVVDLGPVPWEITRGIAETGPAPGRLKDLISGRWWIAAAGDEAASQAVLDGFHAKGATGGALIQPDADVPPQGFVFRPDSTARMSSECEPPWPCYRFTAIFRKHHPYSELKCLLANAAPA